MIKQLELIFGRIGRVAYRIASFLYYIHEGRKNGYALCCVLHFAWDGARRNRHQAIRRGILFFGTPKAHVPCGFHKGRHRSWKHWDDCQRQLTLFETKLTP